MKKTSIKKLTFHKELANRGLPENPNLLTAHNNNAQIPIILMTILKSEHNIDTTTDGSVQQNSMTASWAIKLGKMILTGGKSGQEVGKTLQLEPKERLMCTFSKTYTP